MIKYCKGLCKSCVFFVRGSKERLIKFFEKDFVILDGQEIILNHNMLNLKLLVDLLFSAFIFAHIFTDFKDIFLNFRIQLFLKNGKHIAWTDKSVAVVVIEHERY
jgi:hypothetical protein